MGEVDRDGVRIHYDVHDPPAGRREGTPAILLTHGYASSSHMWEANLAALTERHRVITWDLRGHGRSDYPDDVRQYREALAVADMAAILDAAGEGRGVIGGLSLGGYLSLAFHLAHPERVVALMLFDTGPGFKRDDGRDGWNRTAIAYAEGFEGRGLDALPGAGRSEVRRDVHRNADGLALAARGLLTQHDARVIESLPDVAVPALVLVGDRDTPFLAATDYMAAKIPGATKVVLADAGHAANIDAAEAFDRAVLDFLAGAGL